MKFDQHKYWKHENCVDAFIRVTGVSFDDDGRNAILWVSWMVQGVIDYWCADTGDRIKITPEHYDKWKPYEPTGKYRF